MKEIPGWMYKLLVVAAVIVASLKMGGVGRLSWLQHGSDAEVYFDVAEIAFMLGGFGTYMRRRDPPAIEQPEEK